MVKKAAQATPNHLLRLVRKERNWTQKEVSHRIRAPHSFNISRWEQGTAFPSAHYIQQPLSFDSNSWHISAWINANNWPEKGVETIFDEKFCQILCPVIIAHLFWNNEYMKRV
jgi:hypothetical protein